MLRLSALPFLASCILVLAERPTDITGGSDTSVPAEADADTDTDRDTDTDTGPLEVLEVTFQYPGAALEALEANEFFAVAVKHPTIALLYEQIRVSFSCIDHDDHVGTSSTFAESIVELGPGDEGLGVLAIISAEIGLDIGTHTIEATAQHQGTMEWGSATHEYTVVEMATEPQIVMDWPWQGAEDATGCTGTNYFWVTLDHAIGVETAPNATLIFDPSEAAAERHYLIMETHVVSSFRSVYRIGYAHLEDGDYTFRFANDVPGGAERLVSLDVASCD